MQQKTFYDSAVVISQIVLPFQSNAAGNVHGGEIMKMMDSAAGATAMKYAGTNIVTARADELCFKKPIHIGELVTCTAHVVYVGHSSMETFVTVESEDLQTSHKQISLTAFFTMVALDENNKPCAVPPLRIPTEPFVQKLYEEGKKRYAEHSRRK